VLVVTAAALADDAARQLGVEAAREQKAQLTRVLARIGRRRPEAPAPERAGARPFARARAAHRLLDDFGGQRARLQRLAQPARTPARRLGVQQGLGGARVAEQAVVLELVEDALDPGLQFLRRGCRRQTRGRVLLRRRALQPRAQLGAELGAAMLAPGKQAQRAGAQGGGVYAASPVVGSAPSTGTPSDARTLFSISRARSAFSRRNSRALSLPWPIFSPL